MKKTIHSLTRKTLLLGGVLLPLLLSAGTSLRGDTNNWYIATDITGANTTIDTNHLSSWIFIANTDVNIWGGDFVMKSGSSTVADLTFSLYYGALTPTDLFSGSNSAALITNITLSNAQFNIQNPPQGQSYNPVIFQFTNSSGSNAPVALSNGVTYTAALTSPAGTQGSDQYFIKDGLALLSTTNIPPVLDTNTITDIPEPAPYAFMGLGALILAIAYGRRHMS
ncbi:MAG: hypothetical protein K8R57_08720 [Verrucomicrobia bacterium]|nr:hypothetical protein [Verrucomicrobiota bacterium]